MKKILSKLMILNVLLTLVSCNSINVIERSAEDFVKIHQIGTIDGETKVEYSTNWWSMRILGFDHIPIRKSIKLFKRLGLDYDDTYGEESVDYLDLFEATTKSKTEGLSKGDIVTFEIQVKPELNITTEEACNILGVKFIPYDYIVD